MTQMWTWVCGRVERAAAAAGAGLEAVQRFAHGRVADARIRAGHRVVQRLHAARDHQLPPARQPRREQVAVLARPPRVEPRGPCMNSE